MGLKPEVSIPTALATGSIVYTIYNRGLPPTADIRRGSQGNDDIEAARKANAWMAASVVGGISLIAKDATIFIVGGAMVVGLDWITRYSNWTNPLTGRVDLNPLTVEKMPETPADTAATGPAPTLQSVAMV
jgi:hypothetical protein